MATVAKMHVTLGLASMAAWLAVYDLVMVAGVATAPKATGLRTAHRDQVIKHRAISGSVALLVGLVAAIGVGVFTKDRPHRIKEVSLATLSGLAVMHMVYAASWNPAAEQAAGNAPRREHMQHYQRAAGVMAGVAAVATTGLVYGYIKKHP